MAINTPSQGHPWPMLHLVTDQTPITIDYQAAAVVFTGARQDLIAAGVASAAMFPRGRRRMIFHIGRHVPRSQHYATRRRPDGLFEVAIYHDAKPLAHKAAHHLRLIEGGAA